MNAVELFKNCGYRLYANNDNLICYTKDDGTHKRIKFKLKQRKVTIHSDVDIHLLDAIMTQCLLLGWIEEKQNDTH